MKHRNNCDGSGRVHYSRCVGIFDGVEDCHGCRNCFPISRFERRVIRIARWLVPVISIGTIGVLLWFTY